MGTDSVIEVHEYIPARRVYLMYKSETEDPNFVDVVQDAIEVSRTLFEPGVVEFGIGSVDDGWADAVGPVDGESLFQARTPAWKAWGVTPPEQNSTIESWDSVKVTDLADWIRKGLRQATASEGMHVAWTSISCLYGAAFVGTGSAVDVDEILQIPLSDGRTFGLRMECDISPVTLHFSRFGITVTMVIEYAWSCWDEGEAAGALRSVVSALEASGWTKV